MKFHWQQIYFLVFVCLLVNVDFARTQETLSLQEALQAALNNNPTVSGVEADVSAAEADVWNAYTDFLPQVTVNGSYTRFEEPNIIIPIHEVGVFPPLDDRIYEGNIRARIPIFNGGRTLFSTQAARAELAAKRARKKEAAVNLLENVATLYLKAYRLSDQQQIIYRQLQALEQRRHEVKICVTEGRASQNDLALLESSLESSRSDSLELHSRMRNLHTQLGQLLGRKQAVVPKRETVQSHKIPQSLQPSLNESVTGQAGPQLQQAKQLLEKSTSMATAAKLSFMPRLDGFAQYTYRTGEENWDPVGEWAAGLSLNIPIFNGGSRIAEIQSSRRRTKAAEMRYKAAELEQNALLTSTYESWSSIRMQKQRLERAVQNKNDYVKSRQELYNDGRLPLSALLTQENELLDLQLKLKAKMYDEKEQVIRFFAVTGQLTQEDIITIFKGETK